MNDYSLPFWGSLVAMALLVSCQQKNIPVTTASDKPHPAVPEMKLHQVPEPAIAMAPGPTVTGEIYTFVEQMPEFPGGQSAFMDFLKNNIQFPAEALTNKEEGRVIAQFVVMDDGVVTDTKIVKGVSESIDREALRVLALMPRWTPGKQNGRPVHVRFLVPINFSTK